MIRPDQMARTHRRAFDAERPWTAGEFRTLCDKPVSLVTGDARSFVLGRVIADEAEVLTLATDPDHRRQGLAHEALVAFCDAARTRGADTVFLEVAADNTAAIALYAKAGFARTGLRPAYYARAQGAAVDAVLMQRKVT